MVALLLALRWLLGLLFLRAGLAKLRGQTGQERLTAIRDYGVVEPVAATIAALLPWAELAIAAGLLIGVELATVAGLAALILAGFAAAMAFNLTQGRRPFCGCGSAQHLISWRMVGRDLLLCAGCAALIAGPSDELALWPGPVVRSGSAPPALLA